MVWLKILELEDGLLLTTGVSLFALQITVDRGMHWEEAYSKSVKLSAPDEGFYMSYKVSLPKSIQAVPRKWEMKWNAETVFFFFLQLRGNSPCVLLAEQGRGKNFNIYKPNIGKQTQPESLNNLLQRYRKVEAWSDFYFCQ